MRLGLSSIVGDGFGVGSFSIEGALTPPSFPPAGTYYDTQYGVEYPIAEGGLYFTSPLGANPLIPNQTCDVDREHDGSGGIVYDWSTATNVAYKVMGTYWGTDTTGQIPSTPVEVPSGSGFYYDSGYDNPTYEHDGLGGWQNGLPVFGGYYPNGTYITSYYSNQTEVPSGSGNYYDNGTTSDYVWDGNGGYTTATGGAYYANGSQTGISGLNVDNQLEVPYSSGFYYNTGEQTGYTWNGSGGYNYPVIFGTVHPTGTFIYGSESAMGTQTPVEVPSGSGNFYDSEITGAGYTFNWSNPPDYYSAAVVWYPQSGTFIYNDGTNDYYWDGNGGYYT